MNAISIQQLNQDAQFLGYKNARNRAYQMIINKYPSSANVDKLVSRVIRKALKNGADIESILHEGK